MVLVHCLNILAISRGFTFTTGRTGMCDCVYRLARLYPLHKNSTLLFLQYGVSDVINTHCRGI